MTWLKVLRALAWCACVGAIAGPMIAQVPTEYTIHGRITTPEGRGISHVAIRIWRDGDSTSSNVFTDSLGYYSTTVGTKNRHILLETQALGYRAARLLLQVSPGLSSLRDVRLEPLSTLLPGVRVVDRSIHMRTERNAPGGTALSSSASVRSQLPVDQSDIDAIAGILNPAAVSSGDSSGLRSSIGGQPASQTAVTVDGASSVGTTFPTEALAGVSTFTSTYDVSRGQFSGGQIAVTTRSGGGAWQGAVSIADRNPVSGIEAPGMLLAGRTSTRRLGLGGGGPLWRNAITMYAAADVSRSETATHSVEAFSEAALSGFGLSADSLQHLLNVLRFLGMPSTLARKAETVTDGINAMVRFDAPVTVTHTITARIDWRNRSTTGNVPVFSLNQSGGTRSARDVGALTAVVSDNGNYSNYLHLYTGSSMSRARPELSLPSGSVLLQSTLNDRIGTVQVGFGGNPYLTPGENHDVTEFGDDFTVRVGARHEFKLGGTARRDAANTLGLSSPDGVFSFLSIGDLSNGHPSSFRRAIRLNSPMTAGSNYVGLYTADVVRFGRVALLPGVRFEWAEYPARISTVSRVAALSPNSFLSPRPETSVSPRLGFSVTNQQSAFGLHGGIGMFRGPVSIQQVASTLYQGADSIASQVVCIGSAAPVPNWSGYLDGTTDVPTTCRTAGSLQATAPSVTTFSHTFKSPKTIHSSIDASYGKGTITLDGELRLTHGFDQPLAIDRNFQPSQSSTIPNESNRALYTSPNKITEQSGLVLPSFSRADSSLSLVRELHSSGTSDTFEATLQGGGLVPTRLQQVLINVAYTFRYAMTTGTGIDVPGLTTAIPTAGDPNLITRAPISFIPRHTVQLTLFRPAVKGLSFSLLASGHSGIAFTPLAAGDINADGSLNDPAFVFDPGKAGDTAVSRGMRDLLRWSSRSARECLTGQLGKVAAQQSCRSPWTWGLDAQVNYAPPRLGRLSLSVATFNALAGLDVALHGANATHGWGQLSYPDPTLLFVRGFSAATRTYSYTVNSNFGTTRGSVAPVVPFALQVRARWAFGTNGGPRPSTSPSNRVAASGVDILSQTTLLNGIANTPAAILALADSDRLRLNARQTVELRMAADSVETAIRRLADEFQGGKYDGPAATGRASQLTGALLARISKIVDRGVLMSQRVLTQEQWSSLPRTMREPNRGLVVTSKSS